MVGVQDASAPLEEICKNHQTQILEGFLSTPLYNGERKIGALCVIRDNNMPFTDIESHTLTLLANSAAVAITNIRLMEDSRRQTELNATLTERQRLTSELHDEAAQTLSLLNLKVGELDELLPKQGKDKAANELEQFKHLIERAQAQMRMAFSGMNSSASKTTHDISKELVECVKEFRSASGIPVELVVGDLSSVTIPALIQKQAMYIYREALTNVRRYANARKVQVQLERVNGGIQIVVSDDGRGFDPELSKSDHHLGLAVMQARTERVGGTLSIETTPGAGTKVIANIPIMAVTSAVLSEVN
jgi:signal transduction histidine kinase